MKKILLALVVAGCGGKAATPGATKATVPGGASGASAGAATGAGAAGAATTGAGSAAAGAGGGSAVGAGSAAGAAGAAKVSAPVAALPGDGPRAFVADESGLVEVAPGGASQVVTPLRTASCTVDTRAQVVWMIGDNGLYAFDLVDRKLHTVIDGEVNADELVIDWGNDQLGGRDKVHYQVGVAVRMTAKPTVSAELGCDGDMGSYCYEDGDMNKLVDDVAARKQAIDALRLADPAYVATLVARGQGKSQWSSPPVPPVPPKKKPKVDRKGCEEDPKDCGHLTAIPASTLWLVDTANSRGDFYHVTRELWDPDTQEFVWVDGGKLVRAKKPQLGDTDYEDLRISPAGQLSINGVVFDAHAVLFAGKGDAATTCGWSTGGWRMPGVTEN